MARKKRAPIHPGAYASRTGSKKGKAAGRITKIGGIATIAAKTPSVNHPAAAGRRPRGAPPPREQRPGPEQPDDHTRNRPEQNEADRPLPVRCNKAAACAVPDAQPSKRKDAGTEDEGQPGQHDGGSPEDQRVRIVRVYSGQSILTLTLQLAHQSLALVDIEPGRVARLGVFGRAPRRLRRRQHAADTRIARDPFEDGLRPSPNTKRLDRGGTRRPVEDAVAEWTMREDSDFQLRSEREDSTLRLAAERIVGGLDHVEASRRHQVTKIVEAARVIVGRSDRIDLPLPFQFLEQAQLRRPVDEVVDLVDLDAAKQAQSLIGLLPAFRRAAGPDLAGDYRPISATLERLR